MEAQLDRTKNGVPPTSSHASVGTVIRSARESDIDEIIRMARAWGLQNRSMDHLSRHGFLVSDFQRADYEKIIENSDYAFVVEIDRHLSGFLLAYPGSQAKFIGDYTAVQLMDTLGDFLVCKQIAVSPTCSGQGIGRSLYRHLISYLHPGQALIAATVDDPPNNRSRKMHVGLGFTAAYHIQHPDGRPRTVWKYVCGDEDPAANNAR
jgi:predicted GNAT superfamily acetyltransferase